MKHLIALSLSLAALAACQTPGYDYEAQVAPNFPEAAKYRAITVGNFEGPGGNAAETAFFDMVNEANLFGAPWFTGGPDTREGFYSGRVDVTGYNEEERFESEEECAGRDCDYKVRVERVCREQTVDVDVTATLTDVETGNTVFTHTQGGAATQENCEDLGEVPADDYDPDKYEEVLRETLDPYYAPIGMIADAAAQAARRFRYDIAPYTKSVRAEIMKEPLLPEVAADPRYELAVKATKRGEIIGACAQWDELGEVYPRSPGVLHNLGACAEARGDLATAMSQYAKASDIARSIPLLKDKKARPIFDALARVSAQRADNRTIDRAISPGLVIDQVPADPPADSDAAS